MDCGHLWKKYVMIKVSCEEDFSTRKEDGKKINLDIIFMGTKLCVRFEDFSSSLLYIFYIT